MPSPPEGFTCPNKVEYENNRVEHEQIDDSDEFDIAFESQLSRNLLGFLEAPES